LRYNVSTPRLSQCETLACARSAPVDNRLLHAGLG
jgi:hypothetical protein